MRRGCFPHKVYVMSIDLLINCFPKPYFLILGKTTTLPIDASAYADPAGTSLVYPASRSSIQPMKCHET